MTDDTQETTLGEALARLTFLNVLLVLKFITKQFQFHCREFHECSLLKLFILLSAILIDILLIYITSHN